MEKLYVAMTLTFFLGWLFGMLHYADHRRTKMTKKYWKKKALYWKEKFQDMRESRAMQRAMSQEWRKKYKDCREELKECEEEPNPQPAIKSLSIREGKFIVNDKQTKLIGAFKREAFVVGAGTFPKPVNYTYVELKDAFFKSKANYFRVIAPKNLAYFRNEIIDYLNHGKVAEVELYNAGRSSCKYQADWKDTFNAVKDLPVIFDAMNEFMDYEVIEYVNMIVNYVVDHGGLICAGAWGASNHGEEYAKEFKAGNSKYQIVSHHREWTQSSINSDRELGKPLLWSEIHTRDYGLEAIKGRLKLGYQICEGVQVYSLLNFGMGPGSNFQKILDYTGSLVK